MTTVRFFRGFLLSVLDKKHGFSGVKKEYCMYLQETERAVSEYKNHHFFRL